jgi:hypothetical protein
LAIAIIGDEPYLGLAVAVLSGIAVGLASLLASEKTTTLPHGRSQDQEHGAEKKDSSMPG